MSDSFFSRNNINTAVWTIAVALLAFGSGLVWNHFFSKPEKVYVTNDLNRRDTVVNIIRVVGDTSIYDKVKRIERERIDNYEKNLKKITQEYDKLVDSINYKIEIKNTVPKSYITASVLRPKFYMPKIVEGYHQGSISSFAKTECPKKTVKSGEIITLKIDLLDKKWIGKITPLFIDIVKRKSKNSVYQIWSEQYEIIGERVMIPFVADFEKGDYQLTFGFYLKDEINKKYPTFYRRTCNLSIE